MIPGVNHDLTHLADLVHERNAIDAKIATIVGRPPTTGHLGEWIARRVFAITEPTSAAERANDGVFLDGPLQGRTVNIKWYLKREGLLDVSGFDLDHYLVLTGPPGSSASSKGTTRPMTIDAVYLFDHDALKAQGVKAGTASSVRAALWNEAEIYPAHSGVLPVTSEQRESLALFAA